MEIHSSPVKSICPKCCNNGCVISNEGVIDTLNQYIKKYTYTKTRYVCKTCRYTWHDMYKVVFIENCNEHINETIVPEFIKNTIEQHQSWHLVGVGKRCIDSNECSGYDTYYKEYDRNFIKMHYVCNNCLLTWYSKYEVLFVGSFDEITGNVVTRYKTHKNYVLKKVG